MWCEGSRGVKNESYISALGEKERGGSFQQMKNKGKRAGWGMKGGNVVSLELVVLNFPGDIWWRCTTGSHAFESVAHEIGVDLYSQDRVGIYPSTSHVEPPGEVRSFIKLRR